MITIEHDLSIQPKALPKAKAKAIPNIGPTETELEFVARLRSLGVSRTVAKARARKQQLLRCLNAGPTHQELVSIVRRLVTYL